MVLRGVVQCAQKVATQFGDGLALVSFWKNSMGDYHHSKKVFISNLSFIGFMKMNP